MRRALDILVCLLAAPLLIPLAALMALCVFVDSPGPVLYRSWRVGRHGKPFAMLKFRTMRHGSTGPSISAHDDDRFTPLGRALAATRVDELPQVVNVLRGQMRLVGPRPELQEFVDAHADAYAEILNAPPGLTGPAQLRFSSEGRLLAGSADRVAQYRESILPDKVLIDVDYVRTASLLRDVALLLQTALLPAYLSLDAYRAWRIRRLYARPATTTVALVAASTAVTALFSLSASGLLSL